MSEPLYGLGSYRRFVSPPTYEDRLHDAVEAITASIRQMKPGERISITRAPEEEKMSLFTITFHDRLRS